MQTLPIRGRQDKVKAKQTRKRDWAVEKAVAAAKRAALLSSRNSPLQFTNHLKSLPAAKQPSRCADAPRAVAPMLKNCTLIVDDVIKEMEKYKLSQVQVSQEARLSQAAISQWLARKNHGHTVVRKHHGGKVDKAMFDWLAARENAAVLNLTSCRPRSRRGSTIPGRRCISSASSSRSRRRRRRRRRHRNISNSRSSRSRSSSSSSNGSSSCSSNSSNSSSRRSSSITTITRHSTRPAQPAEKLEQEGYDVAAAEGEEDEEGRE